MNKTPKARAIYDNYDLWEKYPDETLMEIARECEWIEDDEEVTDEILMRWRYQEDENDWDNVKYELNNFFKGKTVGFFGNVGRWDGTYAVGEIGEFWKLYDKAIEDCGYVRIYDENGHLYLTCSHHDGTCHFEIKFVSEKGEKYLDNWENNWNDKRKVGYVYGKIFDKYSTLPRFAQKVYGCKAREYEPITKANIISKLNNRAKSFYTA